MPIQLLNGETVINRVNLVEDTIILTDIRLIYQSSANTSSNTFTGLNQIAGAKHLVTPVTYYKLSGDGAKSIYRGGALAIAIVFAIFYSFKITSEFTFWGFFFTFILTGLATSLITGLILYILVGIYLRSTAVTSDKVQLVINNTDGSMFINSLYDESMLINVTTIEQQINEAIFKKS